MLASSRHGLGLLVLGLLSVGALQCALSHRSRDGGRRDAPGSDSRGDSTVVLDAPDIERDAFQCSDGQSVCNGLCTDTQTDRNQCGGCGQACRSNEACMAGTCVCATGTVPCGATCVLTASDPLNCGSCGRACPTGATCAGGVCQCTAPMILCTVAGAMTCVDPRTDTQHCGSCTLACRADQVCSANACGCAAGRTDCSGTCRDLQTDSAHCGTCATQCATALTCVGGVCVCPSGQSPCGSGAATTCVNLQTDNRNCGACGTVCSTIDRACMAGSCQCTGGRTSCSGTCTSTATDSRNCGACGTTCTAGCVGGSCSPVAEVCVGTAHVCARLAAGAVYCWGGNGKGQLGLASTANQSNPRLVPGVTASAIGCGGEHTCAVLQTGGSLRCWGANSKGQLGDGTTTEQHAPVISGPLSGLAEVGGGLLFTCARTTAGAVYCWGDDSRGALGNDTSATDSLVPVLVALPAGLTATELDVGTEHACAVLSNGSVYCWGRNNFNQTGIAGSADQHVPAQVSNFTSAVQVAASADHSCVRLTDRTVRCWGNDANGALGDGMPNSSGATPVAVVYSGGTSFIASYVGHGGEHSCSADTATAAVGWTWGRNNVRQLGDGGTLNQVAPIQVAGGLTSIVQIVGRTTTCAALSTGVLYCWGDNGFGQVGNGGTTTPQPTPVQVIW